MIKSLFYKIYSPKNQDDISIKKTKFNILIYLILFLIFQAIIVIVSIKDSNNRLTFVESKIENDLEIPIFFVIANISSFSYNILNISEIDTNEISYENGCDFNFLNGHSSCGISPYYNVSYDDMGHFYPYYKPSNITFEKTYIRIISNILKIPNATYAQHYLEKLAGFSFKDGLLTFISPPAKVEYLLKKEVYIDRYGNETVHFIPSLVTSPFLIDVCNNLTTKEVIWDCNTVDLSIFYQTNVVLYYYEETDRQLVTRILADVSSISRLVIYLVFVALSFIITRFLFDQKTAWFPNYIRDAIIYHYKYYRVQPNLKKLHNNQNQASLISKILSKYKKNKDTELDSYLERNQYQKLKDESYQTKKLTQGSKTKFKRIFETIEPQDEDSDNLSKVSKVNLLIFVSIMIIISSIILFKNYSYRIANTQFENQDLIELPKLNFSFIGDESYWFITNEILPNGESRQCNFEYIQDGPISLKTEAIVCESSIGNFSNSNSGNITNRNLIVDKDTIYMNRNELYQFNVKFAAILEMDEMLKINNMIIKLSIDDIDYLITPFSNITVLLEKTIFHKSDGITNITMYDSNLIVSQKDSSYTFNETESVFVAAGYAYLNILYQDHEIRHIYEETDFQFAQRIIQYIMAFTSPLSIIIGFIFTYLVIRLLFKTPSAHCDTKVRESIIYFLNYNKKYPEIFK